MSNVLSELACPARKFNIVNLGENRHDDAPGKLTFTNSWQCLAFLFKRHEPPGGDVRDVIQQDRGDCGDLWPATPITRVINVLITCGG